MKGSRKVIAILVLLAALSIPVACGGGGSSTREPGVKFKSLLTSAYAIIGQYIMIDAAFGNIPTGSLWTLFVDDNTNPDDGRTDLMQGNTSSVYKLWDSTGFAAAIYNVGILINVRGTDMAFYAPSTVELAAGTLPTIMITEPSAFQMYTIGGTVHISASATDWTGYTWQVLGGPVKDPMSASVNIASFPYSAGIDFNWSTVGQNPASFYVGVVIAKGDVLSYQFTDFLIGLTVHDVWVPITTDNAPESRYDHQAVWTGTRMIVWGGRAAFTTLLTGGVYDPFLDEWTPTTLTDAPSQRSDFTATWCGDRMIVWGGYGASQYFRTGAEYFPNSNTWVALTTTDAPAARRHHTAVWSGGRLVIWGGQGPDALLNDGGVYDPVTGTWTAISTTDAPSARYEHSAVWTGPGMIVWGGRDAGVVRSGGYWDAGSDTWTDINTTGAPSGRANHYAGYLPSRGMILFGGRDNIQPLNDGAIYNPLTDTWTLIEDSASSPDPYNDSAIILAGDNLFVWGGSTIGYTSAGYMLSLAAGTWSSTTLTDAPTARSNMSAIWTGSVVILFGGSTTLGPVNSGAFYFP